MMSPSACALVGPVEIHRQRRRRGKGKVRASAGVKKRTSGQIRGLCAELQEAVSSFLLEQAGEQAGEPAGEPAGEQAGGTWLAALES